MAHLIYEYSANLNREMLNLPDLMEKMHNAATNSGIFPLAGIRSRAIRCEEFRVADGDPGKGFINLSMKVGKGRDLDSRMHIGRELFNLMVEHLQPLMAQQELAISFEMRELEEHVKFNHKNFRG